MEGAVSIYKDDCLVQKRFGVNEYLACIEQIPPSQRYNGTPLCGLQYCAIYFPHDPLHCNKILAISCKGGQQRAAHSRRRRELSRERFWEPTESSSLGYISLTRSLGRASRRRDAAILPPMTAFLFCLLLAYLLTAYL